MIKGHSLRYYISGNEGNGPRSPRMEGKYGRILKMARTPSREEYVKTLYITGLGIIIIGAAGFVIWWLMTILPTYF